MVMNENHRVPRDAFLHAAGLEERLGREIVGDWTGYL
jgi:hypothetical protein